MYFPWVKVQNNEGGQEGDACLEWQLIGGGVGGAWKEEKQTPTLLSSGCTPRIYKEEGACLPGQQKE